MTYTMKNEVRIPNLTLPKMKPMTLGKYAQMRLDYLKAHRRGTYGVMLGTGTLTSHLNQTEISAQKMLKTLTEQIAQSRGITEAMKQSDPMTWVREMNNARASAEETVVKEMIFA
ncbi:MAG: TnpV protein [Clostridia bacterium]|nr:TnpV protein [Clostridia bacterium]